MGFNKLLGQAKAVDILQTAVKTGRIAHAYLFHGPSGVGKNKAALLFAQALNCLGSEGIVPCESCPSCRKIDAGNHPDIRVIRPEGASVKIAQIRSLQEKAYFKCYEGRFKVIMIDDADLLTIEAANCLLKILEEPPRQTVFILIAEDARKLPATILSRCQAVRFALLKETILRDILAGQGVDEKIPLGLAGGSVGKVLEIREKIDLSQFLKDQEKLKQDLRCGGYREILAWAETLEKDRELLDIVLEDLVGHYRGKLISLASEKAEEYRQDECYAALMLLNKALEYLQSNANTRLVLDVLFINLSKIENKVYERG